MKKIKKWTNEEKDYLVENYSEMNIEDIAEVLNRSKGSIKSKAHLLNLTKKNLTDLWTHEEEKYLKENINNYYNDELCKKLGKSQANLRQKVDELFSPEEMNERGKRRSSEYKNWTAEEEEYLRDNYRLKTYLEIAKDLDRTYRSVIGKITTLNLKVKSNKGIRYTLEETEFIESNYKTMSVSEIAKSLDKTEHSIRSKMKLMQKKRALIINRKV